MVADFSSDLNEKNKSNSVVFIVLGLFLIVVIFLVVSLSAGKTVFFGKAASGGVLSSMDSRLFASPLVIKSGGGKARITVFALDSQSKGILGKNVLVNCREAAVCQNSMVDIFPVQPTTDKIGQAVFDISAGTVGKYEFQAEVDGVLIPQTVTITFQ